MAILTNILATRTQVRMKTQTKPAECKYLCRAGSAPLIMDRAMKLGQKTGIMDGTVGRNIPALTLRLHGDGDSAFMWVYTKTLLNIKAEAHRERALKAD